MTRIKITFPEKTLYQYKSTIGVSMINYGGHLGNDSVLTIFHDARIAFFHKHGLTELNISDDSGVIQNDAAVQYISEGKLHDEITTSIAIEVTSSRGFDIYYKIESKNGSKPIAIGKTGMIMFNYGTKKMSQVPDSFRDLIK